MELLFLGTGAADWNIEKRKDGAFFRRVSSALINRDLLIDPGPHIADYCEQNGCSDLLDGVTDVLITHSHWDHLCVATVQELLQRAPRRIWCNARVAELLSDVADRCTVVTCNTPYAAGNYTVTPLRANHTPNIWGEESLLWLIEGAGTELFYGLDSAWLPCESWNVLKQKHLDCAVLEITMGDGAGDYRIFEHNNIRMAELMLETFRSVGVLSEKSLVCASHFAKHAHEAHEALAERLKQFGVLAAYDGLKLSF